MFTLIVIAVIIGIALIPKDTNAQFVNFFPNYSTPHQYQLYNSSNDSLYFDNLDETRVCIGKANPLYYKPWGSVPIINIRVPQIYKFGDSVKSYITSGAIATALGFTPYNGTANPNGYISSVPAQSFASLTGKPTTLSGYGITDAYPLTGNPSGFITTNNVYAAGFGLTKTGSEPNATFIVNQSDIMTVSRATDSIASIDAKINGKVPASRTITINGNTQDLSANRTWTIAGVDSVTYQTKYRTDTMRSNLYAAIFAKLSTPTVGIAARTLNSNFTPSTTRPVFVSYSLTCQVTNPLGKQEWSQAGFQQTH